jgi:hypothetical protein
MNFLGIRLTLMIGPTLPVPAPSMLTEVLESVEVTHSDQGRSGFQITFQAGRSGPTDLLDYSILSNPLLKVFNRVVLVTTFNAIPEVLMDGIITNQQLIPSNEPGDSKVVVMGEDLSVMMDMEEKSVEHPAQDETVIANKIILSYAQYGLIPKVLPPPVLDMPIPTERVPVQQGTDLQYLQEMAERYGYVFYVTPGPVPLTNTAYWGPPIRVGMPQKALSVNMGPDTNVDSVSFRNNALGPAFTFGRVQDRVSNQEMPVATVVSTRIPLSSQPAWIANQPHVRRTQFRQSGLNVAQALSRAQGATDASMDDVVTADGELDATNYGALLKPRALVGLRGVGYQYDGFYYVKSVTHTIQKGTYKQRFTLKREGVGAISPGVPT